MVERPRESEHARHLGGTEVGTKRRRELTEERLDSVDGKRLIEQPVRLESPTRSDDDSRRTRKRRELCACVGFRGEVFEIDVSPDRMHGCAPGRVAAIRIEAWGHAHVDIPAAIVIGKRIDTAEIIRREADRLDHFVANRPQVAIASRVQDAEERMARVSLSFV